LGVILSKGYKSSFVKDLKTGGKAETLIMNRFNEIEIKCVKSEDKKYDLILEEINKTIEVKYDVMSQVTGNIAVEYYNCKKDTPSGLSATECDLWSIVIPSGELYIIKTKELKKYFDENKGIKDVSFAGDKNAVIRLYPVSILKEIFINLKDMSKEEFLKWI